MSTYQHNKKPGSMLEKCGIIPEYDSKMIKSMLDTSQNASKIFNRTTRTLSFPELARFFILFFHSLYMQEDCPQGPLPMVMAMPAVLWLIVFIPCHAYIYFYFPGYTSCVFGHAHPRCWIEV